MEAIRPDEEPVLKTGDGAAVCEFESHGFRLGVMVQQEDASMACWRSGRDSRSLHLRNTVL